MSDELHADCETRSVVDLPKAGAHKYFEHESTEVLCVAYAFNAEEPDLWHPGLPVPQRVCQHITEGGIITAWNAAFERLALKHKLRQQGWPEVQDRQFRCTMTEALGMAFPAKLEKAAPAMNLKIVKDDAGHRLMMQMCKPRNKKNNMCFLCRGAGCEACYGTGENIIWWEDADRLQRLYSYCMQDVRTEAAMGEHLLRLKASEQELYFLDMKINDRGVFIDADLCHAAQHIVEVATRNLDREMENVTGGFVQACSNTGRLVEWLGNRGVKTDSVDREHVEDLLILDLPADCQRALELRQEGSKTSTAKIKSMLTRRQADGRMRGNLQFYGAGSTGRWAARGTQLQNLTRPVFLDGDNIDGEIKEAIKMIYGGSATLIELCYGAPLTLVADCVRSMICAPPGKILRSSDFSNIEGRCVAWEAGQDDKLDAFRAFDDGTGPDLYLIAAGAIYSCSLNDAPKHRKIGKVSELSLGFQGGPGAFARMAKNYGVRIHTLYTGIWANSAAEFKDQALENWDTRGFKKGIVKEGWLAAEVIKLAWRAKNWRIAKYWGEVEDAAVNAMRNPGMVFEAGPVKYKRVGTYLFCLLPSGRGLCYPYARLRETETPWGAMKSQIVYKALDQFTKKWTDKAFYGGLGVENITQAIARDIMAEAMLRVEKAGYEIVLTVHDEIVNESPVGFGSFEEYKAIMSENPKWAPGLPISADGWEGERYHK